MISPRTSLGGWLGTAVAVVGMLVRCYAAEVRGAIDNPAALASVGTGLWPVQPSEARQDPAIARVELCLRFDCPAARGGFCGGRFQPAPGRAENPEASKPESLQCKLQRGAQHAHSIFHAAPKIDGGRILEILRRTRHFANAKSKMHTLRQHLVVKDKVVGILQ